MADENVVEYQAPSLDSVLAKAKGQEPEPPAKEPEPAAEPTPEPDAPKDAPPSDPAPAAEPEKAEPKADDPEVQKRGLLGAVQSERQKRQAAEAAAKAAQAELEQFKAQQSQVQQFIEAPPTDLDGTLVDVGTTLQQARVANIALSERLARINHQDFDEKFAAFQEVAVTDPALFKRVMDDMDAGEAAYREGSRILLEKQYGAEILRDPLRFREAILAEAQKAPAKPAPKAPPTQHDKKPTDISQARSASSTPPEWSPKSLEDILASAKRKRG